MAERTLHLPEFDDDLVWVNGDEIKDLDTLEDSITIVFFWCMSDPACPMVLRNFNLLQSRHSELNVIGIHTPYYDYEKGEKAVRTKVEEFCLNFLVAHDVNREQSKRLGIDLTPSYVLVNEELNIVASVIGEIHLDDIKEALGVLKGESDKGNETVPNTREKSESESFVPEDIALSPDADIVAVSNPVAGEVIFLDDRGEFVGKLDRSCSEFEYDGDSESGEILKYPTGLSFDGPDLLVCDSEQGSLFRVDFSRDVISREFSSSKQGDNDGLVCPYRIVAAQNYIWISSTGSHTIWRGDPVINELNRVIGSGSIGLRDGLQSEVNLASPMGLETRDEEVFFVDSHTGALRSLHVEKLSVHTFFGSDSRSFGDRDGDSENVLMQFPVDLTKLGEEILVVDSYNHKLKRYNVDEDMVKTWLGGSEPGDEFGDSTRLREPRGIDRAETFLYLADSANRRILKIESETGRSRPLLSKK